MIMTNSSSVLPFLTPSRSPTGILKRPFHLTAAREICEDDKEFMRKVMKLDPRDRPTAQELLEDKWFQRS